MAALGSTYYLGRLNIISAHSDGKKAFLLQGLTAPVTLPAKTYEYGFFKIEEVYHEDEEYFSRLLVKYRPSEPSEVVDTDTRAIEGQEFRNQVRAKSRFFLHIKSGIIAYQVFGEITEKGFKKTFCNLLERAYDNLFIDAEIQTINHEVSFFDSLERLESISNVTIYLHPSNPSNRDIWRRQDERFHELELQTYKEEYKIKSHSNGSRAREDEEIKSKLHMASDGYGKATITGKFQGETQTITTGDNPVTCNVEIDSDEEPSTQKIMSQIIPTFKSIFKRMKDVL